MKFALGEIRELKDPIANFLDLTVPVKVAWKLNKLVKALDKELSDIEEARISLVQKYGETDAEGNIQVTPEAMIAFTTEFNELLSEEVEIDFEPIDIEALGDIELTTKQLLGVEKLFK